MRRAALLLAALLPVAAEAQVYLDSTRTEAWVPIASIPGIQGLTNFNFSNADNGSASITVLPFAFNYFGVDYTRVNLSSNGFLTFGTEAATSATNPVPGASTGAPNHWIAPLWDDLIHPAVANARWGVVGTAPNRALVIEAGPASRRTATTGTLYYQMWLFEGLEGHFEYRATGDPVATLDATIGYEGAGGRRGYNAGGCTPANACASVPADTTFVTERARPPELSGTLTVSGRGAFPGVPVTATANLRNLGVDTATSVVATIYLSTNTTLDAADVIVGTVGPIDVDAQTAGTTTTTQIVVPASVAPGDYVVIFHTDSADDWVEVTETDNIVALTPRFATAHEIRPSAISIRTPVPLMTGDPLALNVTMQNDALPVIGPVTVDLYASTDRTLSANDVLLGQLSVTLTGADPQALIIETPLPALPMGGYYPIAVFDAGNDYPEITETNDTIIGSTRFFVGIDFAITSITVPAQLPPGNPISIRSRLDSAGAPYTGPVSYQLFASLDTVLDGNDSPLGEFTVTWAQNDFIDDTRLLTFPAAPGRYYVLGRIDPNAALTEIDENNNTRASSVAGFNAPDLSITTLSFTPTLVVPGATATVTSTLRSLGLTYTDYVPYGVYLSRDSTLDAGDLLLITSSVAMGAVTSRSLVVPIQIPAGALPGSYRVLVSADPGGLIPEVLETNNTFASTTRLSIPGAELEVISMSGTSTAVLGVPYPVELVVTNRGVLDASSFSYAYYVSNNPLIRLTDTRVFTSATASIAAGATRTFSDTVLFPAAAATSTVYLGVIVDVFGEIPEISEVDNVGRVPTPIRVEVPRANLIARELGAVLTGRTLALTRTIANDGSAAATSELAYYLSTNPSISAADVEVGRVAIQIAAGDVSASTDMLTIPATVPAGRYVVGLVADPDAVVDETAEGDNVAIAAPIELIDAMLTVLTERLPEARVGLPYRATLSASGGVEYAWSISIGTLPAGLALDPATGVVSGTPSTSGTFTLTFAVASGAARGERALELPVVGVPPALAVLTSALPAAIAVRPYTAALRAIGGAAPLVWSSPDLPDGLELSTNGILSGVPRASARITVRVEDTLGASAQRTLPLWVTDGPGGLAVTTLSLPDGTVGADYCASGPVVLRAIGGQPPYTWGLDGDAPAGIALAASGALCGTPTATGEVFLDVRATDAAGAVVRAPLVLSVHAASGLAVATTGLPDGTVGVAFEAALRAERGSEPYRFSVLADGGALPPGLALSEDGSVRGVPTLEGVFSFRALVTDADDAIDVQPLFIAVVRPTPAPPSPTPTPTPTPSPSPSPEPSGCACGTSGGGSPASLMLLIGFVGALAFRRRAR